MSNENIITTTTPATIPTAKVERTIEVEHNYTTREGKFETCCICGAHMPIVYAPNGNPTDIGMFGTWPLVANEMSEDEICCESCRQWLDILQGAWRDGDADKVEAVAGGEWAAKLDPQHLVRLYVLADGIRAGRRAEAVSRDCAEPTDTDAEAVRARARVALEMLTERDEAQRAVNELEFVSAILDGYKDDADEMLPSGTTAEGLNSIITRAAMAIQRILDVTVPMPKGAERAESVEA